MVSSPARAARSNGTPPPARCHRNADRPAVTRLERPERWNHSALLAVRRVPRKERIDAGDDGSDQGLPGGSLQALYGRWPLGTLRSIAQCAGRAAGSRGSGTAQGTRDGPLRGGARPGRAARRGHHGGRDGAAMRVGRQTLGRRAASFLRDWSLPRQLRGEDHRSDAARSTLSERLRPRLEHADHVGVSVCPYCAVGCSVLVYAEDGRITHVEGNPESPINAGTLCPKGATLFSLMSNPDRLTKVKYRAPYSDRWEERPDRKST